MPDLRCAHCHTPINGGMYCARCRKAIDRWYERMGEYDRTPDNYSWQAERCPPRE